MHCIQPTKFLKFFKAVFRGPCVNQLLFSVSRKSAKSNTVRAPWLPWLPYRQKLSKNYMIQNIQNYDLLVFFLTGI